MMPSPGSALLARTQLMAALALALLLLHGHAAARIDPDWPAVQAETRPWTRWWWMGSAVTPEGITAELEALKQAGLGGVEITPIYGAGGHESRFVPYLSADWVRLLEHALAEAGRLGLGVDIATGTGWPFGGPWVGNDDACRNLVHRTYTLRAGERLTESLQVRQEPLLRAVGNQLYELHGIYQVPGQTSRGTIQDPALRPGARRPRMSDLIDPIEANPNLQTLAIDQVRFPRLVPLQALMAYSDRGDVLDLTDRVGPDGALDWVAPAGVWTLHALFLGWHGKMVERAAPGGEGNVIDHFAARPIRNYLARFDRAFEGRSLSGLRGFFNDSYEVDDAAGQSDWTPALLDEFRRRRGYDLRRHLPALLGQSGADENARVLADYRETISDLLLETFTTEWSTWASRRGAIVRNQAHGSPANLLDLYAASDIPETEGTELLRFKWASSAANVSGRQLVAAEAATWLNEHFRSSLGDVRRALDELFLGGVNHIVYHGTNYSPPREDWPGWLFYAAVHFNARNAWWGDFPALNQYVSRVQSFLQAGRPDHDVLLYYPHYEVLTIPSERGLLQHFGDAQPVPRGTAFEAATNTLQDRGFTYDFVSDRQLQAARATAGGVETPGGTYRVVVLPESRFIHLRSMERIVALASEGATIVVSGTMPADIAGLEDLEGRRAKYRQLLERVEFGAADADGVREARVGRGRVLAGSHLERLLDRAGTAREPMVDRGLQFVRRVHERGHRYFIVNRGDVAVDGWIALSRDAGAATLFEPMQGMRGAAKLRRAGPNRPEVYLQLRPGESVVVSTHPPPPADEPYAVYMPSGAARPVGDRWQVDFVAGGPELPRSRSVERLGSWTDFEGEAVKRFAGTAVFTTRFSRPAGRADAWRLDLGRVAHSARVRLDGREIAVLIGPHYDLVIPDAQLGPSHELAVSVSNLMANRIADLDRRGVLWKKFYNVNFPARLAQNRGPDGLFSAASWTPLESGLLGPVTLTPLSAPH